MRYEKTLDPEMCPTAIARFVKLLLDIDPQAQVISRLTDVYCKKYPQVSLRFDKAYVDRYTGIAISNERILETLRALGFGAQFDGQEFQVEVPSLACHQGRDHQGGYHRGNHPHLRLR